MLWIIKILGIITVLLSCALFGFYKGFSIKQRLIKIQKLTAALDSLYEHINYGEKELPDAFKLLAIQCPFLQIDGGVTRCQDSDLSEEENKLINDFFESLGRNAKQAECERIKAFKETLDTRLVAAYEECFQKSRLWQTGGVCIGVAVAIMII